MWSFWIYRFTNYVHSIYFTMYCCFCAFSSHCTTLNLNFCTGILMPLIGLQFIPMQYELEINHRHLSSKGLRNTSLEIATHTLTISLKTLILHLMLFENIRGMFSFLQNSLFALIQGMLMFYFTYLFIFFLWYQYLKISFS